MKGRHSQAIYTQHEPNWHGSIPRQPGASCALCNNRTARTLTARPPVDFSGVTEDEEQGEGASANERDG